jgi:putative ABC transport system substrate-binding protein
MRRREFLVGLGSAATWPVVAAAQQPPMPAIGLLHSASPETVRPEHLDGLRQGLAEAGFAEGRNLVVEYRWSAGFNESLSALAEDLVHRRVAVIATMSTMPCARAAFVATKTIPIVFLVGGNPVQYGFVTSLSRPGGNITGVATLSNEMTTKRLQMLHEIVPNADPIALLVNPANFAAEVEESMAAARAVGVRLLVLNATRAAEIEDAFGALAGAQAGALLVSVDPLFFTLRREIIALAARHRIPVSYLDREAVVDGGLMSYQPKLFEAPRIVGAYAGRILRGEKPGDLPVQMTTRTTLALNLRTAKTLDLSLPQSVLVSADEVIE